MTDVLHVLELCPKFYMKTCFNDLKLKILTRVVCSELLAYYSLVYMLQVMCGIR